MVRISADPSHFMRKRAVGAWAQCISVCLKTHWLRGKAHQADERRPKSNLVRSARMASVDLTDARNALVLVTV
jgi:hypothetical protein